MLFNIYLIKIPDGLYSLKLLNHIKRFYVNYKMIDLKINKIKK
jgi:hypothetical protein